jgi:hypothetical protein
MACALGFSSAERLVTFLAIVFTAKFSFSSNNSSSLVKGLSDLRFYVYYYYSWFLVCLVLVVKPSKPKKAKSFFHLK